MSASPKPNAHKAIFATLATAVTAMAFFILAFSGPFRAKFTITFFLAGLFASAIVAGTVWSAVSEAHARRRDEEL